MKKEFTMKWILKLLPTKFKVKLLNFLYDDIAAKGEYEDTELAHVNPYEVKILRELGGAGKVNVKTGLKGYFGGGGSSPAPAPAAPPGKTTTITREAPEIEGRKLALYDEAMRLAREPIEVPEFQVANLAPLEQQAIAKAGQTGVGDATRTAGIASILQGNILAMQQPDIDAFMNPYERYVIDEVNRQSAMKQNEMAAQAVTSGAFGGGREGVQRAEEEGRRLGTIGQLRAGGFDRATGLAVGQREFQTRAAMDTGTSLLNAANQQAAAQRADISQLGAAGALQRQVADRALQAERATDVARAYEPFQRLEFAKGIMTTLPTAASEVTRSTAPGTNPLAQAAGAGAAAYGVYSLFSPGQKQASVGGQTV